MAEIEAEIAAYEKMQADLEEKYIGKWVVVHDGELIAVHESLEAAAEAAVRQFGAGPYLIRQVGAPPVKLPASVMYAPAYAKNNKVRV